MPLKLKSTMIHKNTSSLCKELLGFVHCQFCCRQTTDSRPILGPLTRENHFHLQRNDAHNYNKYAEIFMSLLFSPSYFKSLILLNGILLQGGTSPPCIFLAENAENFCYGVFHGLPYGNFISHNLFKLHK